MASGESRMKINFHVERLVLEGVPLDLANRVQLKTALERELTRMLQNGLSERISAGGAFDRIRGGTITLAHDLTPNGLGSSIAQAIHAGVGKHDPQPAQLPDRRSRE
jgi:hypothetical protein